MDTKSVLVRLTEAQDRELERLAQIYGRSKNDLVREAVTVLIGSYGRMLEDAQALDKDLDAGVA